MDYTHRVNAAIEHLIEVLRTCYQPERIVLFGSWAYGEPSEESDVDLLIIKETPQPFHRRWAEVYQLVQPFVKGIDFSPFVITPQEVAQRQRARDPFLEDILARGTTLYAASG